MERIIFWNNKGGVGKTTLTSQILMEYALQNKDKRVLVIDACPQANLSEILLGGLHQNSSDNFTDKLKENTRATIGGYFQLRLVTPYSVPIFDSRDYLIKPSQYNKHVSSNVDLLCGDALVELQSNAIATLANNLIPGINTWVCVANWLNDFIKQIEEEYDIVFLDANPSFSMYTQIAIATSTRLILPVTVDDSSRRAVQNVFSLVYGLKLPSEIYSKYTFAERLKEVGIPLPKICMIIKNMITPYMQTAFEYETILQEFDKDVLTILEAYSDMFDFKNLKDGIFEVGDSRLCEYTGDIQRIVARMGEYFE